MATKSTLQDPSSEPQAPPPPPPAPPPALSPAVKSETPVADSTNTSKPTPPAATSNPLPPEPTPTPDAVVAHVPSYARWFSWDTIHQCEVRFLPEFFDSRLSSSKNPGIYKYYRNSIVKHYRVDPSRKITFTEVRRILIGDVGSVRRVFDFLEAWGLINYSPSALNKPLKWEDKDTKTSSAAASHGGASKDESSKRVCNHCKSVCSIACFVCDKNDTTLCARCYVRGNYQLGGVSSSDFRRVEINDNSRADWMEKDTLHLLEAVMHYGDDWRKVARHVGRGEKECVSHFLKLPFGEEFIGFADSEGVDDDKDNPIKDHGDDESCTSSMAKRMRLTPLADASNPIMAQAAFLSALAGVEVAKASAQAAVTALTDGDYRSVNDLRSHAKNLILQEAIVTSNDNTANAIGAERALADAKSQLEEEEEDVERSISEILEVQMKEIKDKIDRFEALDLQMEKEWQQLELMKNMLFVDQLTILFHNSSAQNTGEGMEQSNVKTD
ncbi:SWI/SNF complex subunit SWI3B [Humulus lupulus]|uniref:SWI/SNF complex subunit SWI3B n=1 Tax=Humulus lupulus TaxID=3486 RepID=UPI002B405E40|nr:SWI/SNF complex subunit SWI3B [Humulus lupulus]